MVETDLVEEEFDELDRMATEYRSEKSRFPGGDWKLRQFYGALDAPQLTDKDSVDHIAHLEHWMQERPQSITARVALATSLHRWAWVARGDGDFPVHEMDWERIQRGYQALSAHYGATRQSKNQIAFMAYKYKDAALARQQFELIGNNWSQFVWRDRQFFDRARDWAQGHDL